MADLNQVVLIGRLTKDVELKKTSSGTSWISFDLAVDNPTRKVNDKEVKSTSFISCLAYGATAEVVSKYCHKGDRIGVSGRLNQRKWENKNKDTVYSTEVVCNNIQFLTPKASSSSPKDAREKGEKHEGIDPNDSSLPF